MKKFIIVVAVVILVFFAVDYAVYHEGFYIDPDKSDEIEYFMTADTETIYMLSDGETCPFEIRGVNLGSGMPGEWATDFAADEETYLRWFKGIREMGANTIRIYTIQNDTFYNAFYKYNKDNPDPRYLLHGVWVNDYVQNSRLDAYAEEFFTTFAEDCRIMIDVIHGERKLNLGRVASAGHGTYDKDISPWVIGYILGVEWEDLTVVYTDDKFAGMEGYTSYSGKYIYTTADASPFEVMLARVGDSVIEYESSRYGQQRLIAFSNWPTTDPFRYPDDVAQYFYKCAQVDVEHIETTDAFLSGHFASYHVYPYYPDYLYYIQDWTQYGIGSQTSFTDAQGRINSYRAYLQMLNNHHDIPVVISEFGVSTGRGIAQIDRNTGRNQGNMSESLQGQALVDCYADIMATGSAGGCIFTWQDEWFKRTWNTMHAVDLRRTPYWSDYQTNEQYFGMLSFDPGNEESVCYVDGNAGEWSAEDAVIQKDGLSLSVKYDEKFIYFLVEKEGLDIASDRFYIPLDITPKSGSNYCQELNMKFARFVDFVITIDGRENSRVQVQERYEALRSTYSHNVYRFDAYLKENIPDATSPRFVDINLILQTLPFEHYLNPDIPAEVYETGKLRYGNANPESPDFDSLADFCGGEGFIEIRLPWQLLNFSDPSRMYIHDDYYDGNYGVEYIHIDSIYAGVCGGGENGRIQMEEIPLEGWQNKVSAHERLKESYYIMQALWTGDAED